MATAAVPHNYNKSKVSFWSRHDPVLQKGQNADHWSKMRVRTDPESMHPGEQLRLMKELNEGSFTHLPKLGPHGDGRVDPRGHAVFGSVTSRDLHGNVPGNYTVVRPVTCPRSSLKTAYNERARQNYKFWYQERPRPTTFGRYGMGAYKSVLGLGSGPRT